MKKSKLKYNDPPMTWGVYFGLVIAGFIASIFLPELKSHSIPDWLIVLTFCFVLHLIEQVRHQIAQGATQ
jgi:hypothetical protein